MLAPRRNLDVVRGADNDDDPLADQSLTPLRRLEGSPINNDEVNTVKRRHDGLAGDPQSDRHRLIASDARLVDRPFDPVDRSTRRTPLSIEHGPDDRKVLLDAPRDDSAVTAITCGWTLHDPKATTTGDEVERGELFRKHARRPMLECRSDRAEELSVGALCEIAECYERIELPRAITYKDGVDIDPDCGPCHGVEFGRDAALAAGASMRHRARPREADERRFHGRVVADRLAPQPRSGMRREVSDNASMARDDDPSASLNEQFVRDPLTGTTAEVRRIQPYQAGKVYRCPGCQQEIAQGVGHVVVVPLADTSERRHWHTGCWSYRFRRR